MKVKDLIKKLQEFDKNKKVYVWMSNLFEIESIEEWTGVGEEDESNGEAVIYLKELGIKKL